MNIKNSRFEHMKPTELVETEEQEPIPSIPILKEGSSGVPGYTEGDGLLKYTSTSSGCPDTLSNNNNKKDASGHLKENYADVLGFDAFQLASGLNKKSLQPQSITSDDFNMETETNALENNNKENFESIREVIAQDIALNIQAESPITVNSPTEGNPILTSGPTQQMGQMGGEQLRMFHLALPEAKIYLVKVLALFAALIMTCNGVLSEFEGPYYFLAVTTAPLAYCCFWLVVEIFWKAKSMTYLWLENGDFFETFDIINMTLLIITLQLRALEFISNSVCMCIPFLLAAYAHLHWSRRNLKTWIINLMSRYSYAIQVIFLTLKLDNYIDWEWGTVFILTWILLKIRVCHYLYSMGALLYKLIKKRHLRRLDTKIIGFLWWFFYQGLIVVPLIGTYGYVLYQADSKDFTLITTAARIVAGISTALFLMTIVTKKHLLAFIVRMELIVSRAVEHEREEEHSKVKPEMVLELEKKVEYFVMLSPTYYVPLHKSFYAKDKESLKKIKSVFSNMNGKERADNLALLKLTAKHKMPSEGGQRSEIDARNARECGENSIVYEDKLALSVNDIERIGDIEEYSAKQQASGNNGEENSCYICYSSPSNVIFMPCGHSGVCFDCAVAHTMKNNTCMECRKEIEGIYKIDPSPKVFDIVKGYELYKVNTKPVAN